MRPVVELQYFAQSYYVLLLPVPRESDKNMRHGILHPSNFWKQATPGMSHCLRPDLPETGTFAALQLFQVLQGPSCPPTTSLFCYLTCSKSLLEFIGIFLVSTCTHVEQTSDLLWKLIKLTLGCLAVSFVSLRSLNLLLCVLLYSVGLLWSDPDVKERFNGISLEVHPAMC